MTEFEKKLEKQKKAKLEMVEEIERAEYITHNGTFHADEVFSTVLLTRVIPKGELKLARTAIVPENTTALVYDIGLGEYDHHQPGGNGTRENGIKYASFGLLWKAFGRNYLQKLEVSQLEEIWQILDKGLVQCIDAIDNGQLDNRTNLDFERITLSSLIAMFNANWDDESHNPNLLFAQAVEFAQNIFDRFLVSCVSKVQAKVKVLEAIEKAEDGILLLDQFLPWKEALLEEKSQKAKDILFVIFPSNRGGYNVYTVPKELGCFTSRKLFPKSWAGKVDQKLQEVTGVSTATFCHNGRFICSCQTKEDARKLAKLAIEIEE